MNEKAILFETQTTNESMAKEEIGQAGLLSHAETLRTWKKGFDFVIVLIY